MIIFPLTRSLLFASELRNDTRRKMTKWMAESLTPGSKIVLVGGKAYLSRVPLKFRAEQLRKVASGGDDNVVSELRESGYEYLLTSRIHNDRFTVEEQEQGDSLTEVEKSFPLVKRFTPRWGSYGFHNPTISLYRLKE